MARRTQSYSRHVSRALALGAGLTAMACGASNPSMELLDARKAYAEAAEGPAAELAPADLHEAKKALDRAEAQERASDEERHYAYLARREAQLAAAKGAIARDEKRASQAQQAYVKRQGELRERAESALERTQRQLQETQNALGSVQERLKNKDGKVEVLEAERQRLEQKRERLQAELSTAQTELSAAEQAKVEAEKRAAAAIASLEELAMVKEEASGTTITLSGSVLFKTGESDLMPVARQRLQQVAEALRELAQGRNIIVEGHTDSRGTAEMNRNLSLSRAESVMQFLITQGIDRQRLKAVGKGESEPVATNDTPEGRANNRRVELIVKRDEPNG